MKFCGLSLNSPRPTAPLTKNMSITCCRNKQFAVVENPGFWNWTFTLKDIDGKVLAQIDRDWRGFGFEVILYFRAFNDIYLRMHESEWFYIPGKALYVFVMKLNVSTF